MNFSSHLCGYGFQGDRVILGGDHYFRFNHPAEVQSGKRVSCWTGAGDGHKDFEFAKNELLVAQRAQWVQKSRFKQKSQYHFTGHLVFVQTTNQNQNPH